jgi:hypothetical protein
MSTLAFIKVGASFDNYTDHQMMMTPFSLQSAANRGFGLYLEYWQWEDTSVGTFHESFARIDDFLELFRLQQTTVG